MATIKLLLGIFCFAFTGSVGMFSGNLLTKQSYGAILGLRYRLQLIKIAGQEIGVREKTGNNDGERVEEYLGITGLRKGQPYCAAFISWVYHQAGFKVPRSAWSPALFPISRLTKLALPGNLVAVYYPKLGRIGHAGMIEKLEGGWVVTIEGNTNIHGSSEGDGVYRKRRHVKTVYRMADWVMH